MIQTIKMDHWFGQKVEIFKMVSKMAAILKRKLNLKSKWQLITIF